MTRLAIGILIWSLVHFIPSIAKDFRSTLIRRFGEYPYKGVFTLLMIISLYLVIPFTHPLRLATKVTCRYACAP
jgi:uncharacterized membrane protein